MFYFMFCDLRLCRGWCLFVRCLSEVIVCVVYFTVINLPVSLFNLTFLDHVRETTDADVATL